MSAVARGFDRLAPLYDLLGGALFAGGLLRSQLRWLDALGPVERALIPGGGTGRFAAALAERAEVGELLCVDPSRQMTLRSRRRLAAHATPARCIEGTLFDLDPVPCDLICLNYFLDLFDEAGLDRQLRRIGAFAAPGARCLVTDFTPDPLLVPALYAFFRASCRIEARRLPDIDAAMRRHGWRAVGARGGRLRSTLWGPA